MMSEHIHYITDDTFDAEVLQATQPVLVDYWAEWCGPCKMIAPILDEIATQYAGRDGSVSTVAQFRQHLQAGHDTIRRHPDKTLGLGVLCCWNEFGEGSYIEPTRALGLQYLQAVKAVFGGRP